MSETAGYRVSGSDCDDKWRNLVGTYKRNKDKKNSTAHEAIGWEFYELMDEMLGAKASTQPAASQLFSSLQPTVPFSAIQPTVASESSRAQTQPHIAPKISKGSATKRSAKSAAWIEMQKDIQDKRMKMWDEQKDLKLKKIDAINNLSTAILRLAEREQ